MLDDIKKLVKALGTYWYTYFKDKPWFVGLMKGEAALQKQAEQNLAELELSAYRKYIPVHHTELVWAFTLRPEDRNNVFAAVPRYGVSDEYHLLPPTTAATPHYGLPVAADSWYDIGTANLVDIACIVDHLFNPSIVLKRGTDYEVVNGAVVFAEDPVGDKESIQLFAIRAKEDHEWIYKHFGILVNLKADKSSVAYRQIVDDLFNCYINGGSVIDVLTVLASITGNVLAKDDETVTEITTDTVTTDKNVYRLIDRQPAVQRNDKLRAGDSLTTSFTPVYINTLNHNDELPGVVLGKNQLRHYYRGELCFFNRDEKLYKINGLKRFYLGGWPGDADEFWKTFHQHCEAKGRNGNKVLTELAYKGIINPYRFFTDEIGRYHYTLLKIRQESRPTSLDIDDIKLRSILPPQSSFIIHVDTELTLDLTMSADADDGISAMPMIIFETNSHPVITGKIYCHLL
jgi:hypothetical protein